MNIKSFCTLVTAALLLGFAGISFAASSTKPETHSLPVLVKVDSHGKVTSVKPAVELTPPVMQLLKKTLSAMITKPAHDKKGRPIESQIAMVMSVNSVHRKDGQYGVKFGYVSMKPVPTGRWHWSYNGHQYSLVNSDHTQQMVSVHDRVRLRQQVTALHRAQMHQPSMSSMTRGSGAH